MSHEPNHDTETLTRTKTSIREPSMFKVLLLNDDFTPMDFVVDLLVRFFQKSADDATRIMLNVHHNGVGICGVFPREIAETKVMQVNQHARKNNHPLKCKMEKS
ncbi:MAG: ATP-dependent Clp protease adapter ClpS [Magnetococcales bacterium]|nr:ATP-dependent Clp protease adapter ClpS [Magnetococcales bacterium]